MKIKYFIHFCFFILLVSFSCQEEETIIVDPEQQEIIQPNSPLVAFMSKVSANNGAYDNVLDQSSCFSVALPVTIVAADFTVVIETAEDLENLEAFLEDIEDDINENEDLFEFIFPITIIFNDYTEQVIENLEQLEDFISNCNANNEEDVITCVDFVYPISFSVFDTSFDVVDTITIESDQELYEFLEDLENEGNTLIVSLNFPLSLEYANGDILEVNSNEELIEAIELAEDDCFDDELECDLDLEDVEAYLLECAFNVDIENEEEDLIDTLQFNFTQSGDLIVSGDATVVDTGTWVLLETDLGIKLVIEGLQTFTIANGLWLLEDCDDNYELEFVQESENGLLYMELELNCDNEDDQVFDCFGDFELEECLGPNLEAEFNLVSETVGLIDCLFDYISSFHETEANAEANTNAIENTESYWSEDGQVYLRIESVSGNFEIFTVYLNTEDCNYFECFDNLALEAGQCDEDSTEIDDFTALFTTADFTLECDFNIEEFLLTVHEFEADANNAVLPINEPFEVQYTATYFIRIEHVPSQQFRVYEVAFYVNDCFEQSCTEEDVDGTLSECLWNITSFNGSDNLADWNLDFELGNDIVVIFTENETIDATWMTFQEPEGVVIEFSNVNGPNIQAITGSWLVVECTADQLVLHEINNSDNEIVLQRNCD